jgi:hypothetical protein
MDFWPGPNCLYETLELEAQHCCHQIEKAVLCAFDTEKHHVNARFVTSRVPRLIYADVVVWNRQRT